MTRDLQDIPRRWWGKCAISGLLGGAAAGAFLMVTFGMAGRGYWTPLNAIGATLPPYRPPAGVAAISPGFGGESVVGLLIHFIVSALWGLAYGVILGAFVPRRIRSFGWQSLYAIGWGAMLWVFSGLKLFTQAFAPILVQVLSPTWQFLVAHVVYALVTAWVLAGWTRGRDFTVVFAREEEPVVTPRP